MMNKRLTECCPVCGMSVASAQYRAEYHKMHFHCCSQQCLERFTATPQLYASGVVSEREPLLKRRMLRLARTCTADEVRMMETELLEMMGVREAEVDGPWLRLEYDLWQISQAAIEKKLSASSPGLDGGMWQRLRRGLVHNAEENELANLAQRPGACCNRPPRP